MLTMHPVLQVGAYEFAPNPLGIDEFQMRLGRVRDLMTAEGWSHLLVYGSIPDYAALTYLTNFTPRLAPAMALVPAAGAVRLLTFVGGRMVDAARTTTWVEDVEPVKDLAGMLDAWFDDTSGPGRVALAEFANLPFEIHGQIAGVKGIDGAADATAALRDLRRHKSPAEVALIERACSLLAPAAGALRSEAANGLGISACLLAAEAAALKDGAQDVRTLYHASGGPDLRPLQGVDERPADSMAAYIAVKYRGYWAAGFVTSKPDELVNRTLDRVILAAHPGAGAGELVAVRDAAFGGLAGHPLTRDVPAHGIGAALDESPVLAVDGSDTLETGDVISLQAGYRKEDGTYVLASAIVAVEEDGPRVLWHPPV